MKIQIELSIPVSEFVKDQGVKGIQKAFDYCQENGEKAIDEFYKDCGITFSNIEFQEFDSNNWGHANAYYKCTARGSKKDLFDAGLIDTEEQADQ
jgi:hypothetical protein